MPVLTQDQFVTTDDKFGCRGTTVATLPTVADDDYIFPVQASAGQLFYVDAFYFTDVAGNVVTPTLGTVTIQVAADDAQVWGDVPNGTFSAADANSPTRTNPSGQGQVAYVKVNLSAVNVAARAVIRVNQVVG